MNIFTLVSIATSAYVGTRAIKSGTEDLKKNRADTVTYLNLVGGTILLSLTTASAIKAVTNIFDN